MKKIISIFLAVLLTAALVSCSAGNTDTAETTAPQSALDLDLSRLSSTMVYSEVYNMVTSPDSYKGEKIRIKGTFVVGTDYDGSDYYACVIQDATACCQQGMMFKVKDTYTYPDDFPAVDGEILVTGVFDYFVDENNFQVICLNDCDIETVNA